jgi:hypothetical protein
LPRGTGQTNPLAIALGRPVAIGARWAKVTYAVDPDNQYTPVLVD